MAQSLPPSLRAVTQSDLVRSALVVVAALVGLQLLWSARLLVLTAFLGVVLGLAAAGAVTRICAHVKVRRQIAAPLVVLGTVGFVLLILAWTGPTLAEQSQELRTKLPEAVVKVETWLAAEQPRLLDLIAPMDSAAKVAADSAAKAAADTAAKAADSLAPIPDNPASSGRLVGAVERYSAAITDLAFGFVQSTIAALVGVVLVIILATYIAADPDVYRRGVVALLPSVHRARFNALLTTLGATLRSWFTAQLLAMLVIGTVTTIVLLIIGVPAAFPLGVIAGIFEFIPNVGPVLSAVPAIMMGFVDSPRMALIVMFAYWAIQLLENNLLIPYLMKEQLDLPPALTLITQVVMAYVFGILGLFVAIPMLATVVVTVRTLWVEDAPMPDVAMEPGFQEVEPVPAARPGTPP